MTEQKIITKPFNHGDEIDKSRHLTGINKWARSSRTIGTIMLILGWFTVPFEVLFRRDFGQRWFTVINFYAGLLLVFVTFWIQVIYYLALKNGQNYFSWLGPFSPFDGNADYIFANSVSCAVIMVMFFLYVLMGLYHLFKIKWRNQANIPMHSFDDGTSRWQWIGLGLMICWNIFAIPFIAIYWLLIPRKQRSGKPFPKLINNLTTFIDTIVEPAIICILAVGCVGVTRFWLYLSAFSLLIHANWKHMARKTKVLDFQDGKIEAEMMRELRNATAQEKLPVKKKQVVSVSQNNRQELSQIIVRYSDLKSIIEDVHRDKSRVKSSL